MVLNPVRAGMVRSARDWSSYRATAGQAKAASWFCADWILSCFDSTRAHAQEAYREFVAAGQDQPSIWGHLRQQVHLGSEGFIRRVQRRLQGKEDLAEVPRVQRCPPAQSLASYAKRYVTRKDAMALAFASGGYTLKEIAMYFGVHYSTVSRAVKKAEEQKEA